MTGIPYYKDKEGNKKDSKVHDPILKNRNAHTNSRKGAVSQGLRLGIPLKTLKKAL